MKSPPAWDEQVVDILVKLARIPHMLGKHPADNQIVVRRNWEII